jgi:hypothetical protein
VTLGWEEIFFDVYLHQRIPTLDLAHMKDKVLCIYTQQGDRAVNRKLMASTITGLLLSHWRQWLCSCLRCIYKTGASLLTGWHLREGEDGEKKVGKEFLKQGAKSRYHKVRD